MFNKIIVFILSVIIIFSCKQHEQLHNSTFKIVEYSNKFNFSPVFDSVISEFSKTVKKYKSGSINLVVVINIEESKNNDLFKIHLEGVNKDTILKKIQISDIFLKDSIIFCINYNNNNLFSLKDEIIDKKALVEYTQLKKYDRVDTKLPSWLILIESNKISKINHNSESLFGVPKSDTIVYFEENKLKYYTTDEWGYVFDKQGNIVDSLKGK
jgi:hypothetical protein